MEKIEIREKSCEAGGSYGKKIRFKHVFRKNRSGY
ncbi:hypothetical protein JOC77_001237 [Peribacillus deserti]|uniref:Uncharacterized protein n=1 Tax=Peribacillus deserti TaxID=673318 RepID=A0ABS2QFF4_9BACI|nr:hypothetical protein [Peribacillus deserti]